ncbi:MAG: hypothetical protein CVU44_04270 [Chloroflexi bacterium HGW-Chloroflexi-6]|nr:MAG: hypothetical protein CVU44_04270 [Chloroflexi bacterium HGW-Chloroflexi-6]
MEVDPASLDPEERTNKILAIASAALGVLSLCMSVVPICGGTTALTGIGLGLFGMRSESRRTAIFGIGASILGILISVVYMVVLFLQPQ